MKKVVILVTILVATLILGACNANNSNQDDLDNQVKIAQVVSKTSGSKDSEGNLLYNRDLVIDTFKVNPKRVVTFSLGVLDIFDTVGLDQFKTTNLAVPKSNLSDSLQAYQDPKYPNAGTLFEPNYDVLDLFLPELIILDGRTANLYQTLKEKYPNASILDASNTTYSVANQYEIVKNLGKIFPDISKTLETHINQIIHDIYDISQQTKDVKALFVMSSGTNISVSGKNGRYGTLHTDFGFSEADPNGVVGENHGNATSLEYLTKVNPEVIFIMDRAAAIGDTSGVDALFNEPQFQALNAYKNNMVFILDATSWYIVVGGFASTNQMIADIMQYINAK